MRERSNGMTLKKIFKLVVFFTIIFALIFCVTWQNVHMYLLNKDIERLAKKRNELEKSLYLMNIELSKLRSRERIKKIGQEKLDMVPVTYKDIKLIVY
jgi:cell division protein FtsL